MNIHEYQAKSLLRDFGVSVPEGSLANTPAEAEEAASQLGGLVVVKAQVHAGGRGKGGGIKLAESPAEAKRAAQDMIGMTLVTPQTGAEGKLVRKVYVEAGSEIARELYLAVLLDREKENVAVIASTEGGMEIEIVAEKTPEKILTVNVDRPHPLPVVGLHHAVGSLGRGLHAQLEPVARLDVAAPLAVHEVDVLGPPELRSIEEDLD